MNQDFNFRLGIKGRFSVLEDKKTGIEYLVFYHGPDAVCVCPRYNADGSLYQSRK